MTPHTDHRQITDINMSPDGYTGCLHQCDSQQQQNPQISTWNPGAAETINISIALMVTKAMDINMILSCIRTVDQDRAFNSSLDYRYQYGLRWLHRLLTLTWTLASVWPTDTIMALGSDTDHGHNMDLCGNMGLRH